MELPLFIPQVSLRWTKKTPREVLRFAMDCERNDPHKRIAFVNDEPRIKAYTEIAGLSYKDAVSYTMVGCNEPVLPGGIYMGSSQENVARCLENTLYKRKDDILNCATFDEFYAVFESELFSDLDEMMRYADGFNLIRSRDVNLVSSIFFYGSIENAKSITQGGADLATNGLDLIGFTTDIDSLTIIKQFVYDEKRALMSDLLDALESNWNGHEVLRAEILKRGRFFGNNDELSDDIASCLTDSIYRCLDGKKNLFGKPYLVGNLIGYNQHNVWFGNNMRATPDGRYQGEPVSFGIGQSDGKDMNGLTALLSSVASYDPHCIMNGPTVTNISLDEKLIRNNDSFERLVELFETYFRMGGVHFQLTYISKQELLAAKKTPEKHRNLRVRVSGFSDFYTSLNSDLQDDIIHRTEHDN
jgi:formate C-acetyltransferase